MVPTCSVHVSHSILQPARPARTNKRTHEQTLVPVYHCACMHGRVGTRTHALASCSNNSHSFIQSFNHSTTRARSSNYSPAAGSQQPAGTPQTTTNEPARDPARRAQRSTRSSRRTTACTVAAPTRSATATTTMTTTRRERRRTMTTRRKKRTKTTKTTTPAAHQQLQQPSPSQRTTRCSCGGGGDPFATTRAG